MNYMFVVIDGSILMHTAYYSSLPEEIKYAKDAAAQEANYWRIEQNSKGVYTNAIRIFLNNLMHILEQQNPSHVAICFDESREGTFRREIYPEYKSHRQEKPLPLEKQMTNIKTILKSVGIPVLSSERYEADDYAGSLCKTFEHTIPMRFMTKDRDYLQLISPHTKGWMMTTSEAKWQDLCGKYGEPQLGSVPFGCYEFDEEIVGQEYGITPSQIADWKGISGDSSDHLPGISGVSDKSAIPLLNHYGSLRNIQRAIEDAETMGTTEQLKAFWKNRLGITRPPISQFKAGKDQGNLCKELATIKTDLDVGYVEQYETHINFNLLRDLANRLELPDLAQRIESFSFFENEEEGEYEYA